MLLPLYFSDKIFHLRDCKFVRGTVVIIISLALHTGAGVSTNM